MSRVKSVLVAFALVSVPTAPVAAQRPWAVQAEPGSIDNPVGDLFVRDIQRVWTATGEVLENVSIRIRDGVIQEIGPNLRVPEGGILIDGSHMTAMPGIVDEHTHVAMDRGGNEFTAPIVPEVRVVDALNHEDFAIYRALSGGVTTGLVLHGSSNPIGGQGAVIKMRWGVDSPEQLLVEDAPRIVKFALGENVTRKNVPTSSSSDKRFPGSRAGVEAIYIQAFSAAQRYREAWSAYRADPKSFPVSPRRDLRLEALVDIMEGRIRVHAHSYRSDEIVMLIRVAERFGFTIDTFTHVLEGYKVADEIAAHGAGASTFADWWAYKLEAYDAIPYNAAILQEHGVLTGLNSDIPTLQPTLIYEMNKPVKYGGVSKEDALRMMTINPARQLHIEDQVGSLEVGKSADIVLLSGDPFDSYSRVEKTIVDGIVYYDRSGDLDRRGEPFRAMPVTPPIPDRAQAKRGASRRVGGVSGAPLVGATDDPLGGGIRHLLPQGSGAVTVLAGATVHPVSRPPIVDGLVVIQDGRITAAGPRGTVRIPEGARSVDLTGHHLYPGMIDPMTQVGMVEIGSFAASRDDREVGRYNPNLRALSGVHPHSAEIGVTRANGVTAVMSTLSSGVIRGMGSVIQLVGDTPERMAIAPRAAMVIAFPRPSGDDWDEPTLKGTRLEELVELFERSTAYVQGGLDRDDPTGPFEPNVWGGDDVLLGAMVPAVTGEIPVFFEVNTERHIRTLLLFLDQFVDVRAVIVGGEQAFRVAPTLADRHIPVVVGSTMDPTTNRDDAVTAAWENAAVLHAAGVKVSFTTLTYENVRNLPYHAARAVSYGLPPDAALRAVTLHAAEVLGLGDMMGSIDPGKRADLIVTDGDPLQIVTHVERVFIGGEEISVENRQTRLWREFRSRR